MIENILQMLEIAKQQKGNPDIVNVALGKNKLPENWKETITKFKQKLEWQLQK